MQNTFFTLSHNAKVGLFSLAADPLIGIREEFPPIRSNFSPRSPQPYISTNYDAQPNPKLLITQRSYPNLIKIKLKLNQSNGQNGVRTSVSTPMSSPG